VKPPAGRTGPDDADPLYPFTPQLTIERRQVIATARLDADPVPWSRTGSGRLGQRYTPKRYAEHRDALAWALREGYVHGGRGPLTVELGLWCTFARRTRRRVDIDNLAKAVMDAGNGIVWADDSQITLLLARVIIDHDLPHTEVVAYRRELEVLPLDANPDAL